MRPENVNSILLINDYLIMCKTKSPKGQSAKMAQLYLTQKINQLLKNKRVLNNWTV